MKRYTYLWIDLETTGDDPLGYDLLEIAAWAGTEGLTLDGGKPNVHHVLSYPWDPRQQGVAADVIERYTKNGLWREAQDAEPDLFWVDDELTEFVESVEWTAGKPILAGLDMNLEFIREEFPQFSNLVHRRIFDVGTLKMVCPPRSHFTVKDNHRATEGVLEAVEHARRALALLKGAGA